MIRLSGLSKSYGDKVLLDNVNFHFSSGRRYGLVGSNGAGKTTLLGILAGQIVSDLGDVVAPNSAKVAFLPQYPNPAPLPSLVLEAMSADVTRFELLQKLEGLVARLSDDYSPESQQEYDAADSLCAINGVYRLESDAKSLLAGLGFRSDSFDRSPLEFSGGWRMRVELAKLLIQEPDFLILDEPTNHLDIASIAWVEKRLMSYEGVLVFVSHDRDLLDRLATNILHLKNGRLKEYVGDFSHFLEKEAIDRNQRELLRDRIGSEAKRLEDFATRFGAKSSLASRARSKLKMATRLRELESGIEVDQSLTAVNIAFPPAAPSGRIMIDAVNLCFGRDKPLSQPFSLKILRGQRLALIGPNGVGKSTLVRTLVGELRPLSGELGIQDRVQVSYFAQEQAEILDSKKSILETLLESGSGLDSKRARAILGALGFSGLDVDKPVGVLSGGETNRVGLACLLSAQSNFLILDEPTNHLDMASVEVLASALCQFDGSVLFVSHNRAFVNDVCTHILAINAQGVVICSEGNLDDYEAYCSRLGIESVLSRSEVKAVTSAPLDETGQGDVRGKQSWTRDKQLKRERERIRREVDKTEKQMSAIEENRQRMIREMESVDPADYASLRRLADSLSTLNAEMAEAEERWIQLNEDLESHSSEEG